ncbi:MAG TPA: DUF4755 domain-containing protein [Acetobacteraceae bacterium]|nr:DUF4755 domain-containing protein [Acetobacteraceae bacterium]
MTDLMIERKMLLAPHKATGRGRKVPLRVLVPLGFIMLCSLAHPSVFPLAVIGSVLFILAYHYISRFKVGPEVAGDARDALVKFIGREPLYIDTTFMDARSATLAGTGIAWDGQRLYILDAGEVARIPVSAIRSWTWQIASASSTKLYGTANLAMQLGVFKENRRNIVDARKQSGFFVTVADVDKPRWQFATTDETTLRRWEEILTQVQEGRLKAA